MRSRPLAVLLCLLLLAVPVPAATSGSSEPPSAAATTGVGAAHAGGPSALGTDSALAADSALAEANSTPAPENVTVTPSNVTMTIQLQRDGNATWTVTTTFVLRDENDTRAFDRLAKRFETGDADIGYDVAYFRRAAARASNATGRPMQIRDVAYGASTEPAGNATVGRLTVTFVWTNFGTTPGDRLVVGDAFNTSSGTWLPGLARDQTLVIRPPPEYSVDTAPVPPQHSVLRWEGPTSFEPGYLRVVYSGPQTDTSRSPPGTPGGFDLSTVGLAGASIIALGALALGAYVWSRREGEHDGTFAAAGDGGADASPPDAAAVDDAGASDPEAAEDVELLSDEERVESLLQENGGRMKQANIVKETGWSNAKVSQLLSKMDEGGRVDKLRIGRENLISLPDEDVADFDDGDE